MLLDELFGRDFRRFSNFFKKIISKKIKIGISMRVNYIKPEMIPLLKQSKCIVGLGIESADNTILKSMQKGITVDQIEYTLNLLHSNGIPFNGNFIFGDISETIETAKNTLSWRLKHPEYNIFMRLITPYPGSYIYKYAVENHLIQNEIEYLMDGCPQINISKMTDDEFKQVVTMINENSSNHAQQLLTYTTEKSDNGYKNIDVNGLCKVCGMENCWKGTTIFMPTFLVCDKCGSQYYPPLPKEVFALFEQNLAKLLATYQNIALWGIAYHAIEIIKFSGITSYPNIYLIDKCISKHNSTIDGKLINPPEIISIFNIESIIVMVPAHQGMIAGQINHQFPWVKIFNIFDLL